MAVQQKVTLFMEDGSSFFFKKLTFEKFDNFMVFLTEGCQ
jgi:hypothetical protein